QTLTTARLGLLEVVDKDGHVRRIAQDPRLQRCGSTSAYDQGLLQEGLSFRDIAAHVPERIQGGTHAQHPLGYRMPLRHCRLPVDLFQQKAEGSSQVLMLLLQAREPALLL